MPLVESRTENEDAAPAARQSRRRSRNLYIALVATWSALSLWEGLRAFAATVPLIVTGYAADRDSATGRALGAYVVAGVVVMAGSILVRFIGLPGTKRLAAVIGLTAIALPVAGHLALRNRFPLYRPELSAMSELRLPPNYRARFLKVTSDDYYVVGKDWANTGPPLPPACETLAAAVARWGQSTPVVSPGSHCGWKAHRGSMTMIALTAPGGDEIFVAVSEDRMSTCLAAELLSQC